jgi:hypothetical protein
VAHVGSSPVSRDPVGGVSRKAHHVVDHERSSACPHGNVRVKGSVVSRALVFVIAVTATADREILGLDLSDSDDGAFWGIFVKGPASPGPRRGAPGRLGSSLGSALVRPSVSSQRSRCDTTAPATLSSERRRGQRESWILAATAVASPPGHCQVPAESSWNPMKCTTRHDATASVVDHAVPPAAAATSLMRFGTASF